MDAYITASGASKPSTIIQNMESFIFTDDPEFLHGMRVGEKNGAELVQSCIKKPHARHDGIPTLYLDATANESIVQQIFPDCTFHTIDIESSENSNIYQLCNTTITKSFLNDEANREMIINGLVDLIKPYSNPGVITYKEAGCIDGFPQHLAERLGIKATNTGHFGNLRGLNQFEDCDCLIILGRLSLDEKAFHDHLYAIYGTLTDTERSYVDSVVRMKSGEVFTINNYLHKDSKTKAVYDHWSLSETVQAIARLRLIRGDSPKTVFYLANESLPTNIEVSGFLYFDDLFPKSKFDPEIASLEGVEHIRDQQGHMLEILKITPNRYKKSKEEIHQKICGVGYEHLEYTLKRKNGTKVTHRYFTRNPPGLDQKVLRDGHNILGVRPVQNDLMHHRSTIAEAA